MKTSTDKGLVSSRPAFQALRTKAQKGEQVRKIYQSFGLVFFRCGQGMSLVLLVQQCLQSPGDTLGKAEPGEIARHFELDGLRHSYSCMLRQIVVHRASRIQVTHFILF